MRHTESNLQIECVQWFRKTYPMYGKLLFSVPNGGYRSPKEMVWLKKEGLTAGVSDLILLMPSRDGAYHALCIEMKTPSKTSQLRPAQVAWRTKALAVGNAYVTCRCKEQFKDIMEKWIGRNNLTKHI